LTAAAGRLRQAAQLVLAAVARLELGEVDEARDGLERLAAALGEWARDAVREKLDRLAADTDDLGELGDPVADVEAFLAEVADPED
jgi:hypothetical protein